MDGLSFATGPRPGCYRYYGLVPGAFSVCPRDGIFAPTMSDRLLFHVSHGGVIHLVGNMLYLWIFVITWKTLWVTSVYRLYLLRINSRTLPVSLRSFSNIHDRASGAVSGILGAYPVLFPYARSRHCSSLLFSSRCEIPLSCSSHLFFHADPLILVTAVLRGMPI